jgi:hypothetical protein
MSEESGPFLVVYDYGQGGVWWWITARSPAHITDAYRDVQVLERVPDWWTPEQDRTTPRINVHEPDATLRLLLNVRNWALADVPETRP